jgi:hypothetical protein
LTRILFILTLAASVLPLPAASQGTAITYQGQLRLDGEPFTGTANLQFQLFDALVDGGQVGQTIVRTNWPVEDGLFQVDLDFGAAAFGGGDRFLEVWVNGAPLDPRQRVRPAPAALVSLTDRDTLGALSCAEGQVAKQSGGTWQCADDDNTIEAGLRGFSVAGAAFDVPDQEDDRMSQSTFGGYASAESSPDAIFIADLIAPVHLPDGALIQALRCAFYDASTTHNLNLSFARLYARSRGDFTGTTRARVEMSTSGSSTALQEATDTTILGSAVPLDSVATTLWLDVEWSVPTGAVGSTAIRFYGCTVEYSL